MTRGDAYLPRTGKLHLPRDARIAEEVVAYAEGESLVDSLHENPGGDFWRPLNRVDAREAARKAVRSREARRARRRGVG